MIHFVSHSEIIRIIVPESLLLGTESGESESFRRRRRRVLSLGGLLSAPAAVYMEHKQQQQPLSRAAYFSPRPTVRLPYLPLLS